MQSPTERERLMIAELLQELSSLQEEKVTLAKRLREVNTRVVELDKQIRSASGRSARTFWVAAGRPQV